MKIFSRIKKLFQNTLFNVVLIFSLAGGVLFFTLKDDGPQVLKILENVNFLGFLGLVFLMVFERYLLGWGLACECRLTHPGYTNRQGFVNSYTAGLFNNITPGASGGQIAQGYIFRKQGIPLSNSIGVLWLDFIVYQTTMCLFVFILLLLKFNYFYSNYSQFFILAIFGFLVGAAIILFLWVLAMSQKFYSWISTTGINIGVKLHLIKDRQQALVSLNNQLTQFSHEIVVLKMHKKLILILGLEDFLRLLIYYSIPFLCAITLGIHVDASMYLNMLALSSFVAMINAFLPMPGSSGGTEATFVLMFGTIFTKTQAASIMLLWRFVTFYQVLIIGSIVFLYARTRKDVPLQKARPSAFDQSVLNELEKEK